jgi:hypothetical protein
LEEVSFVSPVKLFEKKRAVKPAVAFPEDIKSPRLKKEGDRKEGVPVVLISPKKKYNPMNQSFS